MTWMPGMVMTVTRNRELIFSCAPVAGRAADVHRIRNTGKVSQI